MTFFLGSLQQTSIWFDIGQSVVTSLCAAIAVGVAIAGLRTWRKELVGRRREDVSHRLLLAVYRMEEGFAVLRSPFGYNLTEDYAVAESRAKNAQHKTTLQAELRLIQNNRRRETYHERENDLRAIAHEARAAKILDPEPLLKRLRKLYAEVVSAQDVNVYVMRGEKYSDYDVDPKEANAKMYSRLDPSKDEILRQLQEIVREFEQAV